MSKKWLNWLVAAVSVAMVVYHMIYAQTYLQGRDQHMIFHLGFALMLIFLIALQKNPRFWPIKMAAFLVSIGLFLYLRFSYERLDMFGMYGATKLDLFVGALLILFCLEATRKRFGMVLPSLALLCIVYMFVGPFLPGVLRSPPMKWNTIIEKLTVGFTGAGILGPILQVSALYMFLFMIFAALMETCGGTEFFNQLGKLVSRHFRAGPALASIVTSGLMGSVTGQAGANVTITGSYTIPAMKKVGYAPYQAGAIEAAASTGGPIIPPIMGTAAFLITGVTGIAYGKIIAVVAVPAFFYILSCAFYVQFQAVKMKIVHYEEQVNYRELFLRLPLFLGSLLIIIVLFALGKTALLVSFWACIALYVLSLLRKVTRPTWHKLVEGLIKGAALGSSIAVTCATLGIIVAVITGTGLGIKLPTLVGEFCGDNLLLLLFMTAIVSIIMGIGLPASATYLVVAIVLAPLLIERGIPLLPAHLFAFFFANFSFLTPPVAIAALFGAQLAGAPYMKTSLEAAKVGIAGFVLPFMIVWSPIFMGDFSRPAVALAELAICALIFAALQAGFIGYFLVHLNVLERGLALFGALLLLAYLYNDTILCLSAGLGMILFMAGWQIAKKGIKARNSPEMKTSLT